jgi:Ca2+-binding EF-hand superfamily protein
MSALTCCRFLTRRKNKGCPHGEASDAPVTNGVSASAATPNNTLLNALSQQKHASVDKGASQPKTVKLVLTDVECYSPASTQEKLWQSALERCGMHSPAQAGKSSSDMLDDKVLQASASVTNGVSASAAEPSGASQSRADLKQVRKSSKCKLKALFDEMDRDKRGYVDAGELAAALAFDVAPAVLEEAGLNSSWYVIDMIDNDEDGKITWDEFRRYSALKKPAALTRKSSSELKAEALRSKALRIHVLVDKVTDDAHLHLKMLACDGEETAFVDMLQRILEIKSDASFSQTEWLEVVRKAADRDYDLTNTFLNVCQSHLEQKKEHWPLRQEALNVFLLGDRNNDGQLDMDEMTEMRQSFDFANALMGRVDLDKSGTVSRGEWLAYIKRLADINEQSAAAVLELYKCALTKTSPVLRILREGDNDIPILEDSSPNANQRWWACCKAPVVMPSVPQNAAVPGVRARDDDF